MSKPIRVFYSAFSGRLYATRHYKIDNGLVTVTGEKFDVTSDVGAAVVENGLTFTAKPKIPMEGDPV
jgi:hypothetical protein